jgi:hypothetical protein
MNFKCRWQSWNSFQSIPYQKIKGRVVKYFVKDLHGLIFSQKLFLNGQNYEFHFSFFSRYYIIKGKEFGIFV